MSMQTPLERSLKKTLDFLHLGTWPVLGRARQSPRSHEEERADSQRMQAALLSPIPPRAKRPAARPGVCHSLHGKW